MSWMLRLAMGAMCAMLLMPGDAQANREDPECECEASHWMTVDTIWSGEALEEHRLEAAYCTDLRVYRNLPYAREGMEFRNEWVLNWFQTNEPRYTPVEGVTDEDAYGQMSKVDKALIASVLQWEDKYECDKFWEEREAKGDSTEPEAETAPEASSEESEEPAAPEYLTAHLVGELYEVDGVAFREMVAVTINPNFVIDEVFNHRTVESEWLVPFTCRDLLIVGEAASNRSSRPSSQDQLTLLRVGRERRAKGCEQPDTD